MHVMMDCAATLGSRFNLIFDPHGGCVWHNAYGDFRERPFGLTAGIRLPGGEVWCLPFRTAKEDRFPYLEQFSSLTSVEYRGVHPALRVEFSLKVRAPFYPGDVRLSTAPFYYVDLTVSRLDRWRWTQCDAPLQKGEIVFALESPGADFERTEDGIRYKFVSSSEVKGGVAGKEQVASSMSATVESQVRCLNGSVAGPGEIRKEFDLSGGKPVTLSLIWTAWSDAPVLEVRGVKTPFKYHEFFSTERKMVAWAQKNRQGVEAQCEFLDGLFRDWSLGSTTSHFSALALHSFLADTWWTTLPNGRDWFSVWEGSCYFHSTVDVEYNNGLIYFALWPELLDLLLEEWSEFEVDARPTFGAGAKGTSFLCHDMGQRHFVGQQVYPHHMEIEENANYLLMLAARTYFTGDLDLARKLMPLCRRLAEFIIQCDTTGNGFPDRGTANTIDDGSPALQYGKQQTYLAVKAHAALWAMAEMEDLLSKGKESHAEHWKAFASKGTKTLNEKAWLKDHFAVTLTKTTKGITDPWTGKPLPEGELKGWNDFSLYTDNGLLYLFVANIKMPRWNHARFAQDTESAERATRTPYGCRHTGSGDAIIWFSQNLWRDYTAAYLGVDMLANIESYWDYQLMTGDNLDSSLYYDTTPQNNLNFYPRGATVFGAAFAAAGLRLNRIEKEVHLSPLRSTMRVPLLPLVDWKKMRAPWLVVRNRDGVAIGQITERDLLGDLSVRTMGMELEKA